MFLLTGLCCYFRHCAWVLVRPCICCWWEMKHYCFHLENSRLSPYTNLRGQGEQELMFLMLRSRNNLRASHTVTLVVKNSPANAGDRDADSILGSGRFPGGGHGNPARYYCLEDPMDRGAWWATVQRVAELDTTEQLNTLACWWKYCKYCLCCI